MTLISRNIGSIILENALKKLIERESYFYTSTTTLLVL